jgi:signal peptidase II
VRYTRSVRSPLPPLALAAALLVLDQWTKAWVLATIGVGERLASFGLGFHLTHTRNTGVAFGFLREFRLILGPVLIDGTVLLGFLNVVVGTGIAVVLVRRGAALGALTRTGLALVLAGAYGNAIDRLRIGYVVDFIHFQTSWLDFPVFNVADACVVIGAGLILLAAVRRGERPAAGAGTGSAAGR